MESRLLTHYETLSEYVCAKMNEEAYLIYRAIFVLKLAFVNMFCCSKLK